MGEAGEEGLGLAHSNNSNGLWGIRTVTAVCYLALGDQGVHSGTECEGPISEVVKVWI